MSNPLSFLATGAAAGRAAGAGTGRAPDGGVVLVAGREAVPTGTDERAAEVAGGGGGAPIGAEGAAATGAGAAAGMDGSLIVALGVPVGLGGSAMRTVSFFGSG